MTEKVKNELVLGISANETNITQIFKIDVSSIEVTGNASKHLFSIKMLEIYR